MLWNFVAIGAWRLCPRIESNKTFPQEKTNEQINKTNPKPTNPANWKLWFIFILTPLISNRQNLCLFKILFRKYWKSEQPKELQDTAYSEDEAESLDNLPASLYFNPTQSNCLFFKSIRNSIYFQCNYSKD